MAGEQMLAEKIDEPIIRMGKEFLKRLRKRIKIQSAFWIAVDDGKLKLWIVSPQMDTLGPRRLFDRTQEVLGRSPSISYPQAQFPLTLTRIGFLSPSDPFIGEAILHRQVNEFANFSPDDSFFYVIVGNS